MKKKIILISYLFIILGCSNYIPKNEVSDIKNVDNIESIKTSDNTEKTNENLVFSNEKWWTIYDDENLNQLMDLTLESNTDLKIAMLNIEKASATIDAAEKGAFKMGLYANGGYYGTSKGMTKSKAIGPQPIGIPEDAFAGETAYVAGAGLKASYNFNFYDKYGNLAKQQRYIAEGAAFHSKLVELNLTTNLAKLYGYYIYLEKERENLKFKRETLTSIEDKVKATIKLGNGTPEDLLQVQNKILALNKYINLNNLNRKSTVEAINSLSSYKNREEVDKILKASTKDNFLNQNFLVPTTISSDVIVNRPDVQYYLMMIESEKAKLTASKSDFYPQISIGGDIGYRGLGIDNSFQDFSSLMWSFGPKVYLPIFNLSGVKTNYKISGIQVNIFIENYNKTINGAIKDINEKLTSVQIAKLNSNDIEQNYENNKRIYENSKFKLGIGSISEYKNLSDKYVYLGASLSKDQQNYKVYSEQIDLINSLGGVYKTKDEIEKNNLK
jgi:outer membrane protein TolC